MVSQFVQYYPAGAVLAFVWKTNGLQQNVIPDIHRHYSMFANAQPQCGCLPYGVDMNNYLGWKACTVCYPFGCNSDNQDSDCDGDYTFDAGPILKLFLVYVFNGIVGLG